MNNSENKSNIGLYKAICAILIGVVLIFIVGIAANGWQKEDNGDDNIGDDEASKGDSDNTEQPNGDTDKNDGTADNNTSDDESVAAPEPEEKFYNYLTGLECSEETSDKIPYAFILEPNAPLYGVSDAEILVEIPIENGKTRYLFFENDVSSLGKLGALAPTRNYISQIIKFFGGILTAHGSDDLISYSSIPQDLHLDMQSNVGYIYKENGKNIYTDSEKLKKLTKELGIDTSSVKNVSLPFLLSEGDEKISGNTVANTVIVPYSENGKTKLVYSSSDGKYTLMKADREKIDMLTGKAAAFTNAFILFSDMVTYETAEGTETVVKAETSGTGYYLTGGTLTEIRWSVDASDTLKFVTLTGEELTVNRGNSYICYYKASESNAVIFE